MLKLRRLAPGRSGMVSAIKLRDARILSEEAEVSDDLRQRWRQVFGPREHQRQLLARCTEDDAQGLPDYNRWAVNLQHLQRAIDDAPAFSPGPDGILLQAWKPIGPLGTDGLWGTFQTLSPNKWTKWRLELIQRIRLRLRPQGPRGRSGHGQSGPPHQRDQRR